MSNKGGFALRPRLPEDGDLMIRVNEHTIDRRGARGLGVARRITAARVSHAARDTESDSAGAGAAPGLGTIAAAMGVDAAALLTACSRVIAHDALCYGYDPRDPAEKL